jgi:hypothetical protein
MSLLCHERGTDIEFGEVLRSATHPDMEYRCALSPQVIDRIPERERLIQPRKRAEGGMNIHNASSTRNFNGSYTLCDYTTHGFLFAVSEETARKFLPRCVATRDEGR